MEINGMNGAQGSYYQTQANAGQKEEGTQPQGDSVQIGGNEQELPKKKPGGGIACYMVGPLPKPKPEDAQKVEEQRQAAIENAVNDGIMTREDADRLRQS